MEQELELELEQKPDGNAEATEEPEETGLPEEELLSEKAREKVGRYRLLYLYRILIRRTDAEHTLTTNQLIRLLKEEHGIHVNRNTITKDLQTMHESGLRVEVQRSTQNRYYYDGQLFELPELKLLIDVVSSARFITQKNSESLIEKLKCLANDHDSQRLKRNISVSGRVKSDNEKGYYILDAINDAINMERKIRFKYLDYTAEKEPVLRNNGEAYIFSPYEMIWDGDYYYVVGYCDSRAQMQTFRLDRIAAQPEILEEEQTPPPEDFDLERYTGAVFRMYGSADAAEVELVCENSLMKYVLDRFGFSVDSEIVDEEHFRVRVGVSPSPTFYRWVFGWGGRMKITGPEEIREEYRSMARRALED